MQKRRKILKTAGSVAAVGFTGTVSGRQENKEASLKEVGIYKPVKNLFEKNKYDRAIQLLEKHDIKYFSGHGSLSSNRTDNISTQAVWSKGDSEIYPTLTKVDGDLWLATNYVEVKGASQNLASAYLVDDAIGIAWDHDNWTSPDTTADNAWYSAHGEHSEHIDVEYDKYNQNGLAAKVVYDGSDAVTDDDFGVNLQTEVIRDNDDPRKGIKAQYDHTWTAGLGGGIDISIAAALISVSPPDLADKWNPPLAEMMYPE
jgi:hypothetical protein